MSGEPIGQAWRLVRDRFRKAGLDTADLDARLLAQEAYGLDAMALIRREREVPPEDQEATLERFAQRRVGGEPVSRIIGEREFWGLRFTLSDATLVPRPETEMLVSEAVELLETRPEPSFIDLGTGSGAIAVAIAVGARKSKGTATDISETALAQARGNAERHGVAERISFRAGNWWQAVPDADAFDVIVSNPPYISTGIIPTLPLEVRLFDPTLALDGGVDGLEAYRQLAGQAHRRLKPGGMLLLEIGSTQGSFVSHMVTRAGFKQVEVFQDLQGLDRMVRATHS
ncbi:MAG: peptide chain release factor N(5)-glutamine methyltransferase [Devosia sp.]